MRLPALVLTACTALALTACGATSASTSTTKAPSELGAAEPASSPALTADPDGTVVPVGPLPQGIAYDQQTGLIAVAVHDPYRILLLDAATLAPQRSIDLPGKARHLTDAGPGGPVLVPDETADQLIEVFLPSGKTRTTAVGKHPHNSIAEPNGDVLVANEFSHSLSRVRDGKVLRTAPGVTQPGGLVVDGDVVAAVDVKDFSVNAFDRTTLTVGDKLPVGSGPTHGVLTSRHRMVVVDTRGGRLFTVGLHPLRILGSTSVPGSPYGVIADPVTGEVWVTLTGRNKLLGFSFATDTPVQFAEYDTVRQPDTVAVAPGGHTLWVTGTRDGVIQRIER